MCERYGTVVPLIFCAAAAVAAATPPAHADEAFLCGPDKVVYVKSSELEAKKASDPCIAAYFGGLPVEKSVAAPAPVARKAETAPQALAGGELALKPLQNPDVQDRMPKKLAYGTAAAAATPRAVPDTDYRNVRIINAEAGESQWFKHSR